MSPGEGRPEGIGEGGPHRTKCRRKSYPGDVPVPLPWGIDSTEQEQAMGSRSSQHLSLVLL